MGGDLIREARLRAGLSQRELGRRAGVAGQQIGRWERGEVDPSLGTLRRVIRAAGLELTVGLAEGDPNEHDRMLILRELERSPEQRVRGLVAAVRNLRRLAPADHG